MSEVLIKIPEINIKEDELKILLAIKLFELNLVSLGKAAEIAGYSEYAFSEILLHRGISPVRYENINIDEEMKNVAKSDN